MALNRRNFGGGMPDWVFAFNTDGSVSQVPGAAVTFWNALTGGGQYGAAPMPGGTDDGTGLLDGTGTPISSVTCDSNGEIPASLQGPSNIYAMAADANGGAGPRRWIFASDTGADLVSLLTQQGINTAQLAFLSEYSPVVVYWNPGTSSYPPRPLVGAPVHWYGPVAPAFGGTAAVDGLDYWFGPTA